MRKLWLLIISLSVISCAPATQTSTQKATNFNGLADVKAALISISDLGGKQLHFNSMSMNKKDIVAGLSIYRNFLLPENGLLTSFKDGSVIYIAEKAEIELNGGGLLCLTNQAKATDGKLQGNVYQLDKADKTAIQAIGAGINEGQEGAQDMLAQHASTEKPVGTCTIQLTK